jgi:hypothetical protein
MTLKEICNEIEKELPIVLRKIYYTIHDLEKSLIKEEKKKGSERFYDYCSKYKNQWILRMFISDKKKDTEALLLYHNSKGHAAIEVSNADELVYLTGHFFERYNERLRLGLKTTKDIIHAYMGENLVYDYKEVEVIEPEISKIFCVIPSGVMLGTHNQHLKLVKANTFLPHDMLGKNKKELEFLVKYELEKYKNSSSLLT